MGGMAGPMQGMGAGGGYPGMGQMAGGPPQQGGHREKSKSRFRPLQASSRMHHDAPRCPKIHQDAPGRSMQDAPGCDRMRHEA